MEKYPKLFFFLVFAICYINWLTLFIYPFCLPQWNIEIKVARHVRTLSDDIVDQGLLNYNACLICLPHVFRTMPDTPVLNNLREKSQMISACIFTNQLMKNKPGYWLVPAFLTALEILVAGYRLKQINHYLPLLSMCLPSRGSSTGSMVSSKFSIKTGSPATTACSMTSTYL